jgi:cholesterol oxidase
VRGLYDVVVVGSGFGGGVSACRLAEAGWRVCVLERGRRFGQQDFVDRPEDAGRLLWHPRVNPDGIFDLRLMRDLSVLCAAGVGGGSLVYANVQLRAPREVFERDWPDGLDRAALDPYYDSTEEALEPRPTPDQPTPDQPPLRKLPAFAALGRLAQLEAERLPLAVHFGEDRDNPFGGAPQLGCTNLGLCNLGCPRHAKNTVDLTYLARAERLGAEVYPLHEALTLERPQDARGRWRLRFRELRSRDIGEVEAPVVVLAAGTLGTSRLLLRNRKHLPGLSPALGTRFSGNGDALGAAFDPQAPGLERAEMHIGPVMTARFDLWAQKRFMVADGALPEAFSGLLAVVRGANALTGWRRHLLLRLRALIAWVGLSDQTVTPRCVRLAKRPPITDSIVFLMIGQDAADGRMRLTRLFRRLDIEWSGAASRKLFDDMCKTTEQLAAGARADDYFAPNGGPLGKFVTVHPLGGCPMADDPRGGVVDQHGRVHGHPGLVVADGSVVPTALGVNPAKTIAALAERSVERLASDGP